MSGSSQKSSSKPVDMTPQAFKNLQSPFADVLASLLGFAPQAPAAPAYSGMTANGVPVQGGTATRTQQISPLGDTTSNGHNMSKQGVPIAGTRPQAVKSPVTGIPNTGANAYVPTGNPLDVLRGIPGYQGPLTAELGANEATLLEKLMGQQSGPGGYNPNSPAQGALNELINRGPGANPFLDAAIEAAQRPTFQALQETLERSLPGRFTQAGQFTNPQGSSAFDRAAAMAARDAGQTSADIASKLAFEGYESDSNRKLDAAKALPGVSETEINSTIANLQAQALPRLIQEMGIERGLQEFQNRMGNLLTTLGIAGGATSPTVANSQKSSGSSFGLK